LTERPEELGARWQSERCPECAFEPEKFGPADLPAAVGGLGRRYRAPLERLLPGETTDILRAHPLPDTWSALSYACHVRDVLVLFDGRIGRMLTEVNPDLGWWDHEAAVKDDGYDTQDPAEVAQALGANANGLAATLSGVPERAWGRTGRRVGETFTVLGAARFVLHEGHHHLLDIGRVLRAARGR
jgi:DinB family protein